MTRRAARTKESVIHAFAHLARERPYDSIKIGDVLEAADVGRSTFYAHYRGKDDVLVKALSIVHEALADCLELALRGEDDGGRLEHLLEHFRENKILLRRLSTGSAAEAYGRSIDELAARIARSLVKHCAEHGFVPSLPVSFLAATTAQSQMALVKSWVESRAEAGPSSAEMARAMRAFATAGVDALLSKRGE